MIQFVEDQFVLVARDAASGAARVRCSTEDYREGLGIIIDELQMALVASEQDKECGLVG